MNVGSLAPVSNLPCSFPGMTYNVAFGGILVGISQTRAPDKRGYRG